MSLQAFIAIMIIAACIGCVLIYFGSTILGLALLLGAIFGAVSFLMGASL